MLLKIWASYVIIMLKNPSQFYQFMVPYHSLINSSTYILNHKVY